MKIKGQIEVWEPTPKKIIKEILHFSQISSQDTIFDLGCGDGRIIIPAAKIYGARAVGFEIDPWLVKETKKKAKKNNVNVEVYEQDIAKVSLSQATVVYLYLSDDVIHDIFPIIYEKCEKGTKLVVLSPGWVTKKFPIKHKKYPPYKEMKINVWCGKWYVTDSWKIRMWIRG